MMPAFRSAILTVAAITILLPAVVRATEPAVELQRNPFERPAVETLIANNSVSNVAPTAEGDPYLRAVLAAGSKSVVDLGGIILQIGESANGYQLLSVEEDRATFSKDDETVVLSVYEQESSEEQ